MIQIQKTHWIGRVFVGTALLGLLATQVVAQSIPLVQGMGAYTRKVTTTSPQAQAYFNQGLALSHGFNHGAAIRSFQEAAKLDPECAMAHWGIAYASGPHINFPLVPPPMAEQAWKELTLAKQYASKATPVEQDVIAALAARYANPQPEDRAPLDRAYAEAMRKVWQKYPNDPDVGAWFAEAMMDLRPWDQWTKVGDPQPGTQEVVATLDAVLKLNINHPFANHLYIHAVEASQHPDKANEAADRLRTLQPGLAHNVHMPSHIDIRNGRWQQAVVTNENAIEADKQYRQAVGPASGLLHVYIAHNRHMLSYAAMMTGQSELSIKHIQDMVNNIPEEFIKEFAPVAEGFMAVPDEALVRFGKWDTILAQPEITKDYMPFTKAFRHASKAIAYAAKGEPAKARAEQKTYLELAAKIPAENAVGNNTARDVVAVVTPMLEGEILVREGKTDQAIEQLRAAVKLEDNLRYDEPPAWMIPVRHSLGALLLNSGRIAEAEQVYRDDLKHLPNNGWALYGLSETLRRQGKNEEAAKVRAEFEKVWSKADMKINTSCLCQPATS